MENFFGSKLNRFLTTIILGLVVVALGAYAYYTMQQARYFYTGPTTISVSGEGEVMAEGDDAVTAQDASATKINEINDALEAAGVDRKDIKTEYYSLYPKYNYETMPCIAGMYCPGEQVQDGFEVNQTILVKVRNLETAGALLGLVGDKGATNISGLSFTIDDDAALKDEAREMAIADAKAKAEVLANNLGVRLTKMVGNYEDEGYPVPYYGMGGDMMVKQEMSSVTPDLPTGENITTSRVTLTFQVK